MPALETGQALVHLSANSFIENSVEPGLGTILAPKVAFTKVRYVKTAYSLSHMILC